MTQRIFDVNNEQDMKDLWNILPDEIKSLYRETDCSIDRKTSDIEQFIKIKWNNCYEIHRPTQEATEADIGKLCVFWDNANEADGQFFGIFRRKTLQGKYICDFKGWIFHHCRRLTKQEIEELC